MRPALLCVVIALWLPLAMLFGWEPSSACADEPTPEGSAGLRPESVTHFNQDLKPFAQQWCVDCHGGDEPSAGMALDTMLDPASLKSQRKLWSKVAAQLKAGAMPPDDAEQPTPEVRQALGQWLEGELNYCDCSVAYNPGRVTIRRLNRTEYNNTIRDLMGIDFQPATDFPADDLGYGFDNIGDVLSISPILLEKYLAAAQQISQRAIQAGDPTEAQIVRAEAEKLSSRLRRGSPRGEYHVLTSRGHIILDHRFPLDGEYVLRARAFGQQAGNEPARMQARLDDQELKVFDVEAVADEPAVYEIRTEVTAGEHRFSVGFVNDFYQPDDPDPANRDRNLLVDYLEIEGPFGAEAPPLTEAHRAIIFREPKDDADQLPAAREILRRFVGRASRRPATEEELTRLTGFVTLAREEGQSFEHGIQLAVQAVLVSPHFLFRIEAQPADAVAGTDYDISEYELASRLSYFLWSSMPDEPLLALAAEGKLRQELGPQVKRMLADPKSAALIENFATQWLQIRRLDEFTPDPERFPKFDDALRQAMQAETVEFFGAIVRDDRSVLDLLDADFTFVNQRLAEHYGIEGIEGDAMQRVAVDPTQRGGILMQGSILTVTSNPTRTAPVKRGKWILEQLLGTSPPPPPPDVPLLEESEEARLTGSLRERFEQHRKNPTCASCHTLMDTLGFGLENYDAIGAWRDRDGEFPIDASGTMPDGVEFATPGELKLILKKDSEKFVRCLTEKLMTYALGRGIEYYDQCAVNDVTAAVAEDGYRFSRLVVEIVESVPFQKRRVSPGE
jgi:hypothetical protein